VATKDLDIKTFAERVERLCDFFIGQIVEESGRNGSEDLKVLEDLKEDAADISCDRVPIISQTIAGLREYMNGVAVLSTE
jgi:hypothetical protein